MQRFRSITLPFLAPTIAITILLRTVWIANFADLIIVMTNGGPADTDVTNAIQDRANTLLRGNSEVRRVPYESALKAGTN